MSVCTAITARMEHVPLLPLQSYPHAEPVGFAVDSCTVHDGAPFTMQWHAEAAASSWCLETLVTCTVAPSLVTVPDGSQHASSLPGLPLGRVSWALMPFVLEGLMPLCVGPVSITWASELSLPLLQWQRSFSCESVAVLWLPVPSAVHAGVSCAPHATSATLLRIGEEIMCVPQPAGEAFCTSMACSWAVAATSWCLALSCAAAGCAGR